MGHWYDSEGNPRHFEGKDGKGTTLREARKLDLYPSVTTIGQVKYKFGLEKWKIETVCKYALTQGIDKEVYVVVNEAFEELDKQAQDGTDIHDILEKYFVGEEVEEKHIPMCERVFEVIQENTYPFEEWTDGAYRSFKTETRFCDTEHGFAGMCDLHNSEWVIDYKSKDTVDEKTKGWKEQAEQLAAYAHGLGYPNARLANVFISREPPPEGEPWGVVWYEHKDDMAWQRFRHTLMLWQVENKYGPYFEAIKGEES